MPSPSVFASQLQVVNDVTRLRPEEVSVMGMAFALRSLTGGKTSTTRVLPAFGKPIMSWAFADAGMSMV